MRGINANLLRKRYANFNRTLVTCVTTISRHNPEATALLSDVGEVAGKINELIDFIEKMDAAIPTPLPKPKPDKPKKA